MKSFLTCLAVVLAAVSATATAAPAPPSISTEWAHCRSKFSAPSTAPSDSSYPGGISEKGTVLTPATIPGVTTVTVRQAECLIDRMGSELVVAGIFTKGDAVPYSYAMPFAGTTRTSLSDQEQELVDEQIRTVAGTRLDRPVLVYCHHESCMPSHNAAIRLVAAGYRNVFWMREGVKGWKAAGLRVGNMNGPSTPAKGGATQPVPRREHLGIGYTGYPQPPWLLEKDGDRLVIDGKRFRTGRLCLMLGDELRDDKDPKAAAAGMDLYRWQAYLYEMAGVDARTDNDVAVRRKMQAFWRNHGERIYCSRGMVLRETLLKHALMTRHREFVEMYLHDWRLPVNGVDHTDGFTALDAVINEANSSAAPAGAFQYEYDMLRWLGGMTRREAEAAGVIPTERQLQARYITELESLANAGNHRASHQLSWIFMQGDHADVDEAEAGRWWELMERQALQQNDHEFMVYSIGRAYMRWENKHNTREYKPMRPENNAAAVQWYRRAAEGGNRAGMHHYGRALAYGWAGSKDEEAGLQWLLRALLAGDDQAAVHMANVYAGRGDVRNVGVYGRSMHPMDFSGEVSELSTVGMSVKQYFDRHGLSWCGPRAPGLDPRPASECD